MSDGIGEIFKHMTQGLKSNKETMPVNSETYVQSWSDTRGEIFAALARVQGALTNVQKNTNNPFFKSTYADLSAYIDATRGALTAEGLCVVSSILDTEGPIGIDVDGEKEYGVKVYVQTTIGHKSGEFMTSVASAFVQGIGSQQVGSATSYLRRYGLAAALNLAQTDDDGNASSGKQDAPKTQVKEAVKTTTKADHLSPVMAELKRLAWPREQTVKWLENRYKKTKISDLTVAEAEDAARWLSEIRPTTAKKED